MLSLLCVVCVVNDAYRNSYKKSLSQTFLCLIRHIDYKNTKMQGIDQINKGLSFAIEMREQIASKAQDIQTPLNINVIIRRKVESKREKERKGEGG